jgi:hypothetical protein
MPPGSFAHRRCEFETAHQVVRGVEPHDAPNVVREFAGDDGRRHLEAVQVEPFERREVRPAPVHVQPELEPGVAVVVEHEFVEPDGVRVRPRRDLRERRRAIQHRLHNGPHEALVRERRGRHAQRFDIADGVIAKVRAQQRLPCVERRRREKLFHARWQFGESVGAFGEVPRNGRARGDMRIERHGRFPQRGRGDCMGAIRRCAVR